MELRHSINIMPTLHMLDRVAKGVGCEVCESIYWGERRTMTWLENDGDLYLGSPSTGASILSTAPNFYIVKIVLLKQLFEQHGPFGVEKIEACKKYVEGFFGEYEIPESTLCDVTFEDLHSQP